MSDTLPPPKLSAPAVVSVVLGALAVPLLPAVFGLLAQGEIHEKGLRGAKLAKLGIVLGVFWFVAELAAGAFVLARPDLVITPFYRERIGRHHASTAAVMPKIARQQEISKRLDRADEFELNQFWWKDIAGLWRMSMARKGAPEELDVTVAKADAANDDGSIAVPRDGYFFRAVQGTDHYTQFAATAYPARWGVDGLLTFYIDERGQTWSKDRRGAPADRRMEDPAAEGWRLVEPR